MGRQGRRQRAAGRTWGERLVLGACAGSRAEAAAPRELLNF